MWDSLRSLFKTGLIANSEIVDLCRLRLTRLEIAWHDDTILELRNCVDELGANDRVSFWKGIIQISGAGLGPGICVTELKRALAEKSGMSGALEYWKVLIRKFPESLLLSDILQEAFEMEGKEEIAVEFWTKLKKRYPNVRHFTKFLAKNYKSIGDYESAIRAWTTVLSETLGNREDYADVNDVIEELDEILYFERDSSQRVQFWVDSLNRDAAENYTDERLRKLATALLDRSSNLPSEDRVAELHRAAMTCPRHKEVAQALRVEFERLDGDGHQEEEFWRHVLLQTSASDDPWPHVRLAEHYFSRHDYDQVSDCVAAIREDHFDDTELWEAIVQVTPPNSVQLGCALVRTSPFNSRTTEYLQKACVVPDGSSLKMWEALFVESHSWVIARAVTSAMRSEKVEVSAQVQYWQSMIQQYPQVDAACWELENVLSTTTTGSTIDIWKSIIGALSQNPPRDLSPAVANGLHKAFVKLVDRTVSSDFWHARGIWRDAQRAWSRILTDFDGTGIPFKWTVSDFCKEASSMCQFFDESEYDILDVLPPFDPAPHSIQVQ